MLEQTQILLGWVKARVARLRGEQGMTVETVLWIIFLIAAVGVVTGAVMAYLNTKVAEIH